MISRAKRTVGVEIEGVGADLCAVRRLVKKHGWAEVYDASLDDDRPPHHYRTHAYERTCEAVSPPLTQRAEAPRMLRGLKKLGMRVNPSCGLHMHVDAQALSPHALLHLLSWWYQNETTLSMLLGKRVAREDFARTCRPAMMQAFAHTRPRTRKAILETWVQACRALQRVPNSVFASMHINCVLRYWALNFMSLEKHGTVEFRVFEATMEPRRLEAYIALADAIVERAASAGPFTDWDVFNRPRVHTEAAALLQTLQLAPWMRSHFTTMEAQAQWALDCADPRPTLQDTPHPYGGTHLQSDHQEAAHRVTEACLSGARHVDLAGLSLTSLPPCLLGTRTLKSVDLRYNLLPPLEAPRGKHLDLRYNGQSARMAERLQNWATWREAVVGPQSQPQEMARRVYSAWAKQQDRIALSGTEAPPFLYLLRHVRHVRVDTGAVVPNWLCQMPSLQRLTLCKSDFTHLPDWLGELPELGRLDVFDSTLCVPFPDSLRQAPKFWRISGPIHFKTPADQKMFWEYHETAALLPQLEAPKFLRGALARHKAAV